MLFHMDLNQKKFVLKSMLISASFIGAMMIMVSVL